VLPAQSHTDANADVQRSGDQAPSPLFRASKCWCIKGFRCALVRSPSSNQAIDVHGPQRDFTVDQQSLLSFRPLLIVGGVNFLALDIPVEQGAMIDGLRQVCRPGRGASGRARSGICSGDHAGGRTSGAIGLQPVVQLLIFGPVEFVGFFVHGQRESVEPFR
jgi:hypothetical protein